MSDITNLITGLVGSWTGTVRTWLDPNAPPAENEIAGTIARAFDGNTLIHDYKSAVGTKRSDGLAVIGKDIATGRQCMTWVDTFHTGSDVQRFAAEEESADSVTFLGSYGAGDEVWGWRIVLHLAAPGDLRIDHYNVYPDGHAEIAIKIEYRPAARD